MKEARVTRVHAKNTDYPITTSEDDHLPKDHNIKIVQRFLKNKLVHVSDPAFRTNLKIKSGSFDGVETKSSKVSAHFAKTQKEIKDAIERDPSTNKAGGAAAAAETANDEHEPPPMIKPLPSNLSPGKRKATQSCSSSSSSSNNHHSPKVAKSKPAVAPAWRQELELLLQQNQHASQRRRADTETLGVRGRALETAIAVRATCPGKTVSEIAEQAAAAAASSIGATADQLQQYLTGNRQNLLSVEALRQLTNAWEAWLDETKTAAVDETATDPNNV